MIGMFVTLGTQTPFLVTKSEHFEYTPYISLLNCRLFIIYINTGEYPFILRTGRPPACLFIGHKNTLRVRGYGRRKPISPEMPLWIGPALILTVHNHKPNTVLLVNKYYIYLISNYFLVEKVLVSSCNQGFLQGYLSAPKWLELEFCTPKMIILIIFMGSVSNFSGPINKCIKV